MMTEKQIFDYLVGLGFTKEGVAGLMGNLKAESNLNPKNLQNTSERKLDLTDDEYTVAVDNGTYTNFVHDSAGYGLAQWTYWSRKQNLLNFAKEHKMSIGDCKMQLSFLYKELQGYKEVFEVLKVATSIKAASDIVLLKYERPANQSEAVKEKHAQYGQEIYDRCIGGELEDMTEAQIRLKVVTLAKHYLGCNESDGSHKKVIDIYNSHKPLARGYAVKYTDAWCATYGSAIAIALGYTDIIPTECSCNKQIALWKELGRWQEDDAYVPSAGDYIYYDWDDNGSGNCVGGSEHVGIVISVYNNKITVIEGNKNNSVATRVLNANGRYIRGYGLPNYASKAKAMDVAVLTIEEIAKQVIAGKWGNGVDRKNKLEDAGYSYSEVQVAVNAILKGNTVPTVTKSVTEVAKEVVKGLWGNGADRKKRLEAAGYSYSAVQKKVNELL